MNTSQRVAALGPVLVITTFVTSIISSLGAPLIPTIAKNLHVSLSTAQWSLTATLLSGAVCAPVMGRLGDGSRRKATMIGGLVVVTLGGVIAALASGIDALIFGRALQGVGLGLVPLAMATARDQLPKHRVVPMIGLLSVSAAAGVGVGYPISGLITDRLGLSGAYWFGAIVSVTALICVVVVIPSTSHGQSARLDVVGTGLLAGALIAILVAVAQGYLWGWGSSKVLGLLATGVILLVIWTAHQLRAEAPLVNLRLLRQPAVFAADACAFVLGIAMYMTLSAATQFVQHPREEGFGFSSSVVVAGLILIPLSALMLLGSRLLPILDRRFGLRVPMTMGCMVVAFACSYFALFHNSIWESIVAMGVLGIGLGSTFAAIPGLIVRSVPHGETGSALGFYQVVRFVGFSLGSALCASIVESHASPSTHQPSVGGYTTVFWVAGSICVVAALVTLTLPSRGAIVSDGKRAADQVVRLVELSDGENLVFGEDPS